MAFHPAGCRAGLLGVKGVLSPAGNRRKLLKTNDLPPPPRVFGRSIGCPCSASLPASAVLSCRRPLSGSGPAVAVAGWVRELQVCRRRSSPSACCASRRARCSGGRSCGTSSASPMTAWLPEALCRNAGDLSSVPLAAAVLAAMHDVRCATSPASCRSLMDAWSFSARTSRGRVSDVRSGPVFGQTLNSTCATG